MVVLLEHGKEDSDLPSLPLYVVEILFTSISTTSPPLVEIFLQDSTT